MPSTASAMIAPDFVAARYIAKPSSTNLCPPIIPSTGKPMSTTKELAKRQSICDACREMNRLGINQGTSGNISLRHEDGMLITPSATPYDAMQAQDIVFMQLDGGVDATLRPSSEWRFHRDILQSRPEVNAVVHTHP